MEEGAHGKQGVVTTIAHRGRVIPRLNPAPKRGAPDPGVIIAGGLRALRHSKCGQSRRARITHARGRRLRFSCGRRLPPARKSSARTARPLRSVASGAARHQRGEKCERRRFPADAIETWPNTGVGASRSRRFQKALNCRRVTQHDWSRRPQGALREPENLRHEVPPRPDNPQIPRVYGRSKRAAFWPVASPRRTRIPTKRKTLAAETSSSYELRPSARRNCHAWARPAKRGGRACSVERRISPGRCVRRYSTKAQRQSCSTLASVEPRI